MQLYTLEEVADILRVSVQTVRRMINSRELPGLKVKGQWASQSFVIQRRQHVFWMRSTGPVSM